jgi:hypothetical protein
VQPAKAENIHRRDTEAQRRSENTEKIDKSEKAEKAEKVSELLLVNEDLLAKVSENGDV